MVVWDMYILGNYHYTKVSYTFRGFFLDSSLKDLGLMLTVSAWVRSTPEPIIAQLE